MSKGNAQENNGKVHSSAICPAPGKANNPGAACYIAAELPCCRADWCVLRENRLFVSVQAAYFLYSLCCSHMALPVEDSRRLHLQAGGIQVAVYY